MVNTTPRSQIELLVSFGSLFHNFRRSPLTLLRGIAFGSVLGSWKTYGTLVILLFRRQYKWLLVNYAGGNLIKYYYEPVDQLEKMGKCY